MKSIISDTFDSAMVKSPFQVFADSIQTIYPDKSITEVLTRLPVPQMVMIGSESTGKSATLENITKTVMFPTNRKTCTRCPLKVVIIPAGARNVAQIITSFRGHEKVVEDRSLLKDVIEAYFNEIKASSPSGYTDDEITVTFVQPNVVRIDLVDLPGIVSFPPEAREFTTNLCLRYIRDPNSILICVAPATLPRLNAYEPIARILENNAQDRTIITLTMADKLHPDDYEMQLTDRVQLCSDELRDSGFLSCCAVINRASPDVDLTSQPEREREWFGTITKDEASHEQILSRLGVVRLQEVANAQYENFLKKRWLPRTAADMQANINKLNQQISELGPLPNDEDSIVQLVEDYEAAFASAHRELFGCLAEEDGECSNQCFLNHPLTVREITSGEYVKAVISRMLANVEAFDMVKFLEEDAEDVDLAELRLWRFSTYWSAVKDELRRIVENDISDCVRVFQSALLTQYFAGEGYIIDGFKMVESFYATFQERCSALPHRAGILTEDEATAKQRAVLTMLVQKSEVVITALLMKAGLPRDSVEGSEPMDGMKTMDGSEYSEQDADY